MSCDVHGMIPVIEKAVKKLEAQGIKPYRVFVYTLVQDVDESVERIMALKKLGVEIFAQPYRDFDGGEPSREQKRIANWCNKKSVFKTVEWKDFRG